jgi:hypothetical protein
MVASIITFVLKIILGGLFNNMQNKEAEKAKKERDQATIAAVTADEGKDLEVGILEKQIEAEKTFKPETFTDDDPFGFAAFNKEK